MDFTLKRLNFFKGLFTSAEDWQTEQKYHIDKQRLHNLYLHLPGVVSGLDVSPAASGTAVRVSAGHAIDEQGRDVHLERDAQKEINFDAYPQQTTLSVTIRWAEKDLEPRQNGEFSGKAFKEEDPVVEVGTEIPRDAVVLAAISVAAGIKRIREPDDAANPKPGEIDRRVRKRAGAFGARTSLMDAATVVQAGEEVIAARKESDAKYYEYSVTWDAATDGHAFHFASAYPVDTDGQVTWHMGCSRKNGRLQHTLFIRNHERRELRVAFRVYRLN